MFCFSCHLLSARSRMLVSGGIRIAKQKLPMVPLPTKHHCLHCKHKPGSGWTCRVSASVDAVLERSSCMTALGRKSQAWGRGMDLEMGWDMGKEAPASLHFQ